MKKVFLLKFGELFLKGRNRHSFISLLMKNIKEKLNGFSFKLSEMQGRLVVSDFLPENESQILQKLTEVYGLIGVAVAEEFDTELSEIEKCVLSLDYDMSRTFKVQVKRADKNFLIPSMQLEAHLGEVILTAFPHLNVDLYEPEMLVQVEIRTNGKTYVYENLVKCAGGLPLGSAGAGLLLLSGGIDSPVAGCLMAKRGLKLEAVHFHSYPYTSLQAREKVLSLAKIMSKFCGEIKVHVVSFTKIQEEIHRACDAEYMITIMRRIMMRIAEKIARENDLGAIVTGESLGQVASQTMQSINVTNSVVSLPVFRPVIAMDKEEIMNIARKIGTYETSILPYEDCCTVFLPKNPVIKPTIKRAEFLEERLDIDALVAEALATQEIVIVNEESEI